jgi:hypothetical protein
MNAPLSPYPDPVSDKPTMPGSIHALTLAHKDPGGKTKEEVTLALERTQAPRIALRQSMYQLITSGRVQSPEKIKQKIAEHICSFIQYTRRAMPPTLVATHMRARLPDILGNKPNIHDLLLTNWDDTPGVILHGAKERRSAYHFTRSEILQFLQWAEQRPEVTLGIQYAQELMIDYLVHLRDLLSADATDPREDLQIFTEHWRTATNMQKVFPLALHLCGRWTDDPEIDQKTIQRMFEFLEQIGEFKQHLTPTKAAPPGASGLVIACPIEECLRDVLAREGMLAEVIHATVQRIETGSPLCQDIVLQAQQLQKIVQEGGMKLYFEKYPPAKKYKLGV